jgi:hypothetical protein
MTNGPSSMLLGARQLLEAVAGVHSLGPNGSEHNLLEVCDHVLIHDVAVWRNDARRDASILLLPRKKNYQNNFQIWITSLLTSQS